MEDGDVSKCSLVMPGVLEVLEDAIGVPIPQVGLKHCANHGIPAVSQLLAWTKSMIEIYRV